MIDREDSWTIKLQITLRTMNLFALVYLLTRLKNGFHHGHLKQRRNLISSLHGSQETKSTKFSLDQLRNLTGIGLTTPVELNSDAPLVLLLSEKCLLRISTSDAGSHTHTWCSSSQRDSEEVLDIKDQLSSTIIDSMRELCWTSQTFTGGMCAEFFQGTHQFQMLIESGEPDRLQSSINTIRSVTDIEWESPDIFHGMDLCLSQLCHISSIRDPMSSTVPSRETLTLPQHLSDYLAQKSSLFNIFTHYLNG